jgi:hypothetical protein
VTLRETFGNDQAYDGAEREDVLADSADSTVADGVADRAATDSEPPTGPSTIVNVAGMGLLKRGVGTDQTGGKKSRTIASTHTACHSDGRR